MNATISEVETEGAVHRVQAAIMETASVTIEAVVAEVDFEFEAVLVIAVYSDTCGK